MIDTHVHLEFPDFADDFNDVLARAHAAGVQAMICVGGEPPRNRLIAELVPRIPSLYGAVGLHPHWAAHNTPAEEKWIGDHAAPDQIVAIGEIGLDYHYDFSPREVQRATFARYLELARAAGLPVIVHSRDACDDTFEILSDHAPVRGVVHCFSYDVPAADEFLGLGLHVSFCGQITFKQCDELRAVAAHVPLERLLLETDCPFLAPEPCRGRRNEPANVALIAAKHAELRDMPFDALVAATTANAQCLFGIGNPNAHADD